MKNHILRSFAFSLTLLAMGMFSVTVYADSTPGIFDGSRDIGQVARKGNAVYDNGSQIYTVSGSGRNMWFSNDEFHFVWKEVEGNFILRARLAFKGKGTHPHRKMGLMIRNSLTADSPQASATVHGDGLTSFQYRWEPGSNTREKRSELTEPDVLQLERQGSLLIMSAAKDNKPFDTLQLTGTSLNRKVYIGLFVCSHDPDILETATFENVRLVFPSANESGERRKSLGSNLEILDVETGHRKLISSFPFSIEAPNWTNDNRSLIYNSQGLLYHFDLDDGKITPINTGPCKNINNDHVISFDGKILGISNRDEEKATSLVYTMPVDGGDPVLVTQQGPSYLHGWSPDGKFLVYTGRRNGDFDIYRIPSSGGDEVKLTSAPGLDDGPEYSPDGKYIYFNSSRTGTMQIWRMNPDGSHQEQLTFDELNDWFPHVSPDGKKIVFITFGTDVDAQDHPAYKHVYIRMMDTGKAGKPKVIARLYGGQGTMNVPDWSPDSRHIAFVSYTGMPGKYLKALRRSY